MGTTTVCRSRLVLALVWVLSPGCSTSSLRDAPATRDAGGTGTGVTDGGAIVPTPPPDFVWYVLDETSGTTAHDSGPHRYDVTNLTGVTWAAGANFDGMEGGGSTQVSPSYRSPPVTTTIWLTPTARSDETSNGYTLVPYPPNTLSFDVPGAGGGGVGLDVWTNGDGGSALSFEDVGTCWGQTGLLCALAPGSEPDAGPACSDPVACNAGFLPGTEYFVALVVPEAGDASVVVADVYVDGSLFARAPAYLPPPETEQLLHLGCHNDDPGYGTKRVFYGRIRDARVYQRALSATEVAQLYDNGPTLHAPPRIDGGEPDAG